jgi:hypothetical protein
MATHPARADLGIVPRLLTREQAAAYCGLSVRDFSEWVKSGKLPGPDTWHRKSNGTEDVVVRGAPSQASPIVTTIVETLG